jgi:hypothetical protein
MAARGREARPAGRFWDFTDARQAINTDKAYITKSRNLKIPKFLHKSISFL